MRAPLFSSVLVAPRWRLETTMTACVAVVASSAILASAKPAAAGIVFESYLTQPPDNTTLQYGLTSNYPWIPAPNYVPGSGVTFGPSGMTVTPGPSETNNQVEVAVGTVANFSGPLLAQVDVTFNGGQPRFAGLEFTNSLGVGNFLPSSSFISGGGSISNGGLTSFRLAVEVAANGAETVFAGPIGGQLKSVSGGTISLPSNLWLEAYNIGSSGSGSATFTNFLGQSGTIDTNTLLESKPLNRPATAVLDTSTIAFGTVHRGDQVSAVLPISNPIPGNATPSTVDTLTGGWANGGSNGFTTTGSVSLGGGGRDATSLVARLNTGTVGAYSLTTSLALNSVNGQVSSPLSNSSITNNNSIQLSGQVNDYATVSAQMDPTSRGSISRTGNVFTIDLTDAFRHGQTAKLDLLNLIGQGGQATYTDFLSGTFSIASGRGFNLGAFNTPLSDLMAGSLDTFLVGLSGDGQSGNLDEVLDFAALSVNGSGATGLGTYIFDFKADVPEPSSIASFGIGLGLLMAAPMWRRRNRMTAA